MWHICRAITSMQMSSLPMAAGAMCLCKYPASELTESQTNTPKPQQKLFISFPVILSLNYCTVIPFQVVKKCMARRQRSMMKHSWLGGTYLVPVVLHQHWYSFPSKKPKKSVWCGSTWTECAEYNFMDFEHNSEHNALTGQRQRH